ncbi:single-stranded DNA-binding protein [Acidianus sulfidivorans JP7]|uniref:Single-stranded DNA-binding protein n=1 Tax=Acidianus sulfidivorans JP7 TaxID=619593 RepID=A0A2U9IPC2_9CREN|nr:single-stranded DNA-binding protein [Acidianus sulfidivorans]AWR97898.1 single-stranded DNA-binding protein [Acidianus sulfidivorans JP7]
MKVNELQPRKNATLTVKVVSKGEPKQVMSKDGSSHKVADILVGDETGSVLFSVWDDNIEKVSEGDILDITDGYVTVVRGSMRLTLGRQGKMEKSSQTIDNVNTENNLSNKQVEDNPRPRRFSRRY